MAQKNFKKKEKKNVPHGIVFIRSTFNNTIISVTNPMGHVIAWDSTGTHGFKGSRKSTPYAAKLVGEKVMQSAMEHGLKTAEIKVKGPGSGRESALRSVTASGVQILSITDTTPIPHNGCRPSKRRRT